jgi:predicted PurR-regulated permease PerM
LRRDSDARPKIGGWPLAAAIGIVLVFLFFARHILLPFILAAALAFLLTPLVDRLDRHSILPRWVAALGVYAGVLLALGALGYFVGRPLTQDAAELLQSFPEKVRSLITELAGLAPRALGRPIDAQELANSVLAELQRLLGGGAVLSFAGFGMALMFGALLFLVLLLYFLISGHAIADGAFWLVPPEYRTEVRSVANKICPILWRYSLGLAVVVTYASTVAWIGFGLVFHLSRAPLLAVAVGLLELIPLIGPAASIGLVVLVSLQQTGLVAILGLAGFAVALRLSIDQLVGPLVLGQAARLHPVVIIFCFLSGAVLFGVVGLILAVPVAASIKIILATYYAEPVADASRTPKPP